MISLLYGYKTKSNKQNKTNLWKQTAEWCLPEGKGTREDEEMEGGLLRGDERRPDFGGEHTIEYTHVL